ncbi:MAG: pyruvate:ferredoxin (flavodoxin) oxidoreductase, partial [Xanthomonadales bacterium]|nr:pyruvate:ferredoxin (flavodoxin) oxidoreductase [Xanthomonadales bacterium]
MRTSNIGKHAQDDLDFNAEKVSFDGNEAAAYVAYRLSEVCAIYPITPSSTMAELADEWAAKKLPNLWGNIPTVVEMQHEGGAAGAVHGALQAGALSTTFTASQGLMLMLPNMYKIAGELTPTVFHVAARSLAAQGLSIFGDHQDVMAARTTGFAQLASASVQEAHDLALVAHASTLEARVPFIHFFDGFRTSHEVNKISLISTETMNKLVDHELIIDHLGRALNPENPVMRGTAQNPDTYFQGRESVNRFYSAVPDIVQRKMDELAAETGRAYHLFDYFGDPEAESVMVSMGSGASTVRETVNWLNANTDGRYGGIVVRLFRPFSNLHLLAALPKSARHIAVLDRSKEPGANGEPLYQDVMTALAQALADGDIDAMPRVCGGRYGLSSKEFTPAMVKAVFDNLVADQPKRQFTVGIIDDVTRLSLDIDDGFNIEDDGVVRAMFYGLGADGTVGANKNSIKIIGADPNRFGQAYFVYDSKKSGAQTVSHLRFGPEPIDSPYLLQTAGFIGCHQWEFVYNTPLLEKAAKGATLLLNSPYGTNEVWDRLPEKLQQQIVDKNVRLFVIDAYKVAGETGMGRRINTVMQVCFFALAEIMETDEAIKLIKDAIAKTYAKKGDQVVQMNFAAVDASLEHLHEVKIDTKKRSGIGARRVVPELAPIFVQNVTAEMMAGRGDSLPVSKIPVDGTYPTATTQWEKRGIAQMIPEWIEDNCIQCGNCSFVCPHATIRAKFCHEKELEGAPEGFQSAPISARGFPEMRYLLQVYPDDCTGCTQCVDACPVREVDENGEEVRALKMVERLPVLEQQRDNLAWFEKLPYNERSEIDFSNVRGVQFLRPLFEFSGACAGCGETPYLKLATQLFGGRMMVANATGCSSIYGGNLPTTPWAKNDEGRGPAWSNSLFEDNAEFGMGFRLSADHHRAQAEMALGRMRDQVGDELATAIIEAPQQVESQIQAQRKRVDELKSKLESIGTDQTKRLLAMADHFVRRSVWIVGGDGWAYDIGSSGLDHALASGLDINILIMDTEVYSNTGGQMSKSTPLGAVAKFAAGGKPIGKKDVAQQAIAYGNVYVARVAFGANPQQTLQAFREAEAYPGPSLIIAYSHCIAHGINMEHGLHQQKRAVDSGHWPLIRYNPLAREASGVPFTLDSLRPTLPLMEYRKHEGRFRMLSRSQPEEAERLNAIAEQAARLRWDVYEKMAARKAEEFPGAAGV